MRSEGNRHGMGFQDVSGRGVYVKGTRGGLVFSVVANFGSRITKSGTTQPTTVCSDCFA